MAHDDNNDTNSIDKDTELRVRSLTGSPANLMRQGTVYMERQRKGQAKCALHAINNALGSQVVTESDLDTAVGEVAKRSEEMSMMLGGASALHRSSDRATGGWWGADAIEIAIGKTMYRILKISKSQREAIDYAMRYNLDGAHHLSIHGQDPTSCVWDKMIVHIGDIDNGHWMAIIRDTQNVSCDDFLLLDSMQAKWEGISIDKVINFADANGVQLLVDAGVLHVMKPKLDAIVDAWRRHKVGPSPTCPTRRHSTRSWSIA